MRRDESGQATVELACVLPALVLLVAIAVQAGAVLVHELAVVHAAREGARAAIVQPGQLDVERAVRSASGLDPRRTQVVTRRSPDGLISVEVRYEESLRLPLLEVDLLRFPLRAAVVSRVEVAASEGSRERITTTV